MRADYSHYFLNFKFEARTSRQVMTQKETFFLRLHDDSAGRVAVGECGLFRGLSADDIPAYEQTLADLCRAINTDSNIDISRYSSMIFGLETAMLGLRQPRGSWLVVPSEFTEGRKPIAINGLVWMDTVERMLDSARRKIADGFNCVKIKIGQHDFESELRLLDRLRVALGPDKLTLRLDANGAFEADDAVGKLKRLAQLDIHSVEQPIKAGQWDKMAYVCENSPIDIALDEELIGVTDSATARKVLNYINPSYIILKPTLCGGLSGAQRWIDEAEKLGIGWWVTSALESNVGLNALAQWTAAMGASGCQGLGTGSLYTNNFASPLRLDGQWLGFDPAAQPDSLDSLQWIMP